MATFAHHGKNQFFTVEGPGWPPHTTSRALYFLRLAPSRHDTNPQLTQVSCGFDQHAEAPIRSRF